METKRLEQTETNFIEDSIRRAYFTGKKNLNWVVGIIRSTSVRGEPLILIIKNLEDAYSEKHDMLGILRKRLVEEGFTI